MYLFCCLQAMFSNGRARLCKVQVGATYFVRVYAVNAAGLESALDSPPITVSVPADGLSPGVVVAIVCACMVGAATVAGVTAYWLSRTRWGPPLPPRWPGSCPLLPVTRTGGRPESVAHLAVPQTL